MTVEQLYKALGIAMQDEPRIRDFQVVLGYADPVQEYIRASPLLGLSNTIGFSVVKYMGDKDAESGPVELYDHGESRHDANAIAFWSMEERPAEEE